jgi:hypothetical protein
VPTRHLQAQLVKALPDKLDQTTFKLLGHQLARDNSVLIQTISMLLASAGARTSMKSGRGRLSSMMTMTDSGKRQKLDYGLMTSDFLMS